jgi:hypothetical protein
MPNRRKRVSESSKSGIRNYGVIRHYVLGPLKLSLTSQDYVDNYYERNGLQGKGLIRKGKCNQLHRGHPFDSNVLMARSMHTPPSSDD